MADEEGRISWKMSSGIWLLVNPPPPLENAHYVDSCCKDPRNPNRFVHKVAKGPSFPRGRSIPPQRVLSHDRRADLLSPCAAAPAAAS